MIRGAGAQKGTKKRKKLLLQKVINQLLNLVEEDLLVIRADWEERQTDRPSAATRSFPLAFFLCFFLG